MRNEKWANQWRGYINSLGGLGFIPNSVDSLRVRHIIDELNDIVSRNIEKRGGEQ
jgi:hypothetical protein